MTEQPTLNPAQEQAVTQGDGYALVLAGAGSGKTRVIVERMAWLVGEQGVNPRSLLALTFTNRAANEMRERVAERLGVAKLGAWVGTFHSFAAYVLRRHIDRLGVRRDFTIFDATDQLALVKRIMKDLPAQGGNKLLPRNVLSWMSQFKQKLEAPGPQDDRYLCSVWREYHAALKRASGLDFDDLLVYLARLLGEDETARDIYQTRFRFVLVDEYQDTNRAQYVIAKRLSGGHGNLFVVGDEDQSIYSWRGAVIRNILDFEKDYPDAKVFRLEQNYRSTAAILRASNALVSRNSRRLGKRLWTEQKGGDQVRLFRAGTGDDEARFVVNDIKERKLPPEQVAVLFRTNSQSRLMEEALRREGMPYVVVGGMQFYARKEIKDLLAYLRLLVNPADDVSLLRVVNVPTRGIGTTSVERMIQYARERDSSLFQVLRDVEHDQTLPLRARNAVGEFVRIVDDLTHESRGGKVQKCVVSLLERTGYREYIQRSDEKDFRARIEVVEEFVSACAEYDARGGGSLGQFLEELALASDVDRWDASKPSVTLMTCHAAKGLEFDNVFLIGLEDGLLPHATALDSEEELEEERRLCYVAMTRARKRLVLTHADTRLLFGEKKTCVSSRFLDDLPRDELEFAHRKRKGSPKAPGRPVQSKPEAPRAAPGGLTRGTRVRHATFGRGTVMQVTGSGSKARVRIRFESGRVRQFIASVAPLEILDRGGKK
ncbi:MAG: UvrD-helicase domain-containing protein [bacterium]|nr:UvrD-helicase domain-containing protein [bacterium]